MITRNKIGVYERYGGDIDLMYKSNNASDRQPISDKEWYQIDGFMQDIHLISKRKASDDFSEKFMSELKVLCDGPSFDYFVKMIPFYASVHAAAEVLQAYCIHDQ